MSRSTNRRAATQEDVATRNYDSACERIAAIPLLAPLSAHAIFVRRTGNLCPDSGWAAVTANGEIHMHATRRASADEWVYVIAHCLLHLGFGHFDHPQMNPAWNVACCCAVHAFQANLRLGTPPVGLICPDDYFGRDEAAFSQEISLRGIPDGLHSVSVAGKNQGDLLPAPHGRPGTRDVDWKKTFARGLQEAVTAAVEHAGGAAPGATGGRSGPVERARQWFLSSFPLLGALAASFTIIENAQLCQRLSISVAAVDPGAREIYMNPAAGLDEQECRFVLAHEFLHAGLRHDTRQAGRDPFLWNVAADYVINGWLVAMGVGAMPHVGVLYDPALKDLSAEAVYDMIVTDARRFRKLATVRGVGLGDILETHPADWWSMGDGITLDEFYRRCLAQGLVYHQSSSRGFLPAGLEEEIRALAMPPIPWDVALARWFDAWFMPEDRIRTFARPSRRQGGAPSIPLPRWTRREETGTARTFGVVLDTSGSMARKRLAQALGAIASYAMAHDVPAVRVVFCDAVPYDQGYMPPDGISGAVKVKGRGGTVLQPAIDLLDAAADFPREAPILVISDGMTDRMTIRREHAFLLTTGRTLPFVPKGPVFYMPDEE